MQEQRDSQRRKIIEKSFSSKVYNSQKKQALNLIKFSKTLSGPGGLGEAKPISFALLKKRKRLADVSTKLNRKGRIL